MTPDEYKIKLQKDVDWELDNSQQPSVNQFTSLGKKSFEGFTLHGYKTIVGELWALPDSSYTGPALAVVRANGQTYVYMPHSGFMLFTQPGSSDVVMRDTLKFAANRVMRAKAKRVADLSKPISAPRTDGWEESSPGGMLTKKGPDGGIIDKIISTGDWFIIFNNESIPRHTSDYPTREEALKAFQTISSQYLAKPAGKYVARKIIDIRGQPYSVEVMYGSKFTDVVFFIFQEHAEKYADFVESTLHLEPELVIVPGEIVEKLYAPGDIRMITGGHPRYCVRFNR